MKDLIKEIDETTELFKATFVNLSNAELNWKPSSDVWSIAQNIAHIIEINKSYFPSILSLKKGTYKTPAFYSLGLFTRFFGSLLLKSVNPDRKRKVKTIPIWEPSSSDFSKEIFEQFDRHQNEFKEVIRSSQDLVNKGAVICSPANRKIVYSLEMAFKILTTHERRHYEQSLQVYHSLKEAK